MKEITEELKNSVVATRNHLSGAEINLQAMSMIILDNQVTIMKSLIEIINSTAKFELTIESDKLKNILKKL
jgi:hypothetical protein